MVDILQTIKEAKDAYFETMNESAEHKNRVLKRIAELLTEYKQDIFNANANDLENAKVLVQNNKINFSTYNRLKLDENKMRDMIQGLNDLVKLDNPVNKVIWQKELDSNLVLKKVSVPIGLIGIIFEARPDCIIQISSLIIKSGNCAILKGGSESINTNKILFDIILKAFEIENYPHSAIKLIFSHDDVKSLLSADNYIDLIIPRGSNALVKYIKENTKIPVLGHSSGICHIFADSSAKLNDVSKIVIDAKTQYPSACNAVETILVHKDFPDLDALKVSLKNAGIEIIENPDSYATEYGDKIITLKIVNDIDEAIRHINKYGSGHTDSIISNNQDNIDKFMNLVDSSSVMANCSTRFSDGFRYGFGAEVGISTNKTHSRGPVGLDGLTIYKYKLYGSNNIVDDYVSGKKSFTHKLI